MKIAIVHDFLIKNGGAEKFLESLHRLYPQAPIYTLLYDEVGTKGIFSGKDYDIRTSYLQNYPRFIRRHSKILLTKLPKAIEQLDLSEFDLVISSSNSYAHGIITKPSTLHICYCHSPIRYLWDWHSEYLTENNVGFSILGILIRNILSDIRVWDYYASLRPDIWIANSKNVQKRILKYYRQKSIIIYPASDLLFEQPSYKSKDFYLIISRLSKYKKIDLAIRAFNKNGKRLIVVGEGDELDNLKKIAKSNIEFTGFLPTDKIRKILFDCKALIFPGEEDFGLTPVEAMSAGKPVIAYRKGGVQESVVENKTGLFFEDKSPASLCHAIEKFEKSIDKFSPDICHKRADKFSINNFNKYFTSFIDKQYELFKKYEQ